MRANYRCGVAIDSDNWTPDGSDWLSESVHVERVSTASTSRSAAAPSWPPRNGLPDALPADPTHAPGQRLFDEAIHGDAHGEAIHEDAEDVGAPSGATQPDSQRNDRQKTDRQKTDRQKTDSQETDSRTAETQRADRTAKRREAARSRSRRRRKPYRKLRILPRSVIGISLLILAAGLGSAVSGTVLYMRYQYRRDVSDAYIKGFDKRVQLSTDAVVAEGRNAQARIQTELDPLLKQAATGDTLVRLLNGAKASIVTVQTFDEAGIPVLGTGFVAASDAEKTFLLTSYNVVKAAVVRPGPAITVRSGTNEYKATLWTWQADKDLALLIINKGGMPRLDWADTQDTKLGSQVFAVSGLGTDGGAVTSGFVADVSSSGIQHYAPVGTTFQGGPILNDRGKVVAVASRTYAPLGFGSDGVWFAPLVRSACEQLLKCPQGQVTVAGTQR
jgi:S1-C subfamily serine protease